VNSIVEGLINPLIGLLFNAESLSEAMIVTVGDAQFRFGAVLAAVITFLAVALVVYLVFVLPMNTFREHQAARAAAGEPAEEPLTEAELLTQIRDLLAQQAGPPASGPTGGRHTGL